MKFKHIYAVVCSIFGSAVIALPKPFWGLLTLCVLDYIAGITSAIVNKRLCSKIGAKGIAKKVGILSIVAVATIIDSYVIGDGVVFGTVVTLFYIANEALSILENYAEIGLPIPGKLREFLKQLKSDGKSEDGKGDTES